MRKLFLLLTVATVGWGAMMVPVRAQEIKTDTAISALSGVKDDTTVAALCLCAGKLNRCTTVDKNCTTSNVSACGGVQQKSTCNEKSLSNNTKAWYDVTSWCNGAGGYICDIFKGSESATFEFRKCISEDVTPAAPLRLIDVPARCDIMRSQLTAIEEANSLAEDNSSRGVGQAINIRKPLINILIPDLTFSDVRSTTDEQGNIVIPWIGEYIAAIYRLAVTVASILAVVLLIREGALIILSGGGEQKITGYRNIARILVGLMLAWSSYVILFNINASLVSFRPLQIRYAQVINVDAADEDVGSLQYNQQYGSNNVPYFPQWSGPWAEKKPGDSGWPFANAEGRACTTIHQRGCGITSLAMVLKFYGQDVTPLDTAVWGLGCTGAWQPSLTMSRFSTEWPDMKGEIIWKGNTNVLKRKIMTLLTNNKPIVYNCAPCTGLNRAGEPFVRRDGALGYKGHYVVLTGLITKNYSDDMQPGAVLVAVNDPGANENRRIRVMSLDEILQNFKVAVYVDKAEDFKSVNK